MCAPSPPPPPDFIGAANAQGQANADTARVQGRISNPNIVTPYGSQTVTWGQAPQFDEAGFNKAMEDFNASGGTGTAPTRETFTKMVDDQPTITREFSSGQQTLFNQQQQIAEKLGLLGIGGLDWLSQTVGTPLDTSNAPELQKGSILDKASRETDLKYQLNTQHLPGLQSKLDLNNAPHLRKQYDFSTAPALPQGDEATRRSVADAIMARQQPQFDQQKDALRSDLISRGFREGTKPYQQGFDQIGRQENDARLAADIAGGQEMQRVFGMGMQGRQQAVGEEQAKANFQNTARAQSVAEALAKTQTNNAARSQGFGEELQGSEFQNRAQAQLFNQILQDSQFQNQTRNNAIQEALLMRQLPLSELNSLRTGAQPNMPQFQGYQGANIAPPPIFGATQAQYGAQADAFNAQAQNRAGMMNGLFGLGGAALPLFF